MRKKKIIILVISLTVSLMLGFSLFIYFKPMVFEINIIGNNKNIIKLTRKFGKCNVKSSIINKSLDEEIKKDLQKNGYDKKNYTKEFIINKSCDKLYKNQVKENTGFKLKGNISEVVEVKSQYDDKGYSLKEKGNVEKITNIDVNKIGKQNIIYRLSKDLYNKVINQVDTVTFENFLIDK